MWIRVTTYMDENGRVCPKCKNYYERKHFWINKASSTWHVSWCNVCIKEVNRKNYHNHPNKNPSYKKTYSRLKVKEEAVQKYEPPCIDLIIDWEPIVHEEEFYY